MLIISTLERSTVQIDGATYTVRPLTGGEKYSLMLAREAPGLVMARCGLVGIDGVVIDGKAARPDQIDHLPVEHITAIAFKVAEMSGMTEDTRKKSTSRPGSSSEPSASSTTTATSNGTATSGAGIVDPPSIPSADSSASTTA